MDEEEMTEIWANYFSQIPTEDNTNKEEIKTPEQKKETNLKTPTYEEMMEIVVKLKNRKSPGPDKIEAELIKFADESIWQRLYQLIKEVWEKREMPQDWTKALICPIHKKGSRSVASNYRPISLLNVTYKILSQLINNMLKQESENKIGRYQAGFRSGKSVIDQIFILKQCHEKCSKKNIQIHALLVDFKQAYDKIRRTGIYTALKNLGITEEVIKLIEMTLKETKNAIKFKAAQSKEFQSNLGLKQGDPLSTTIFNIVLEDILRRSKVKLGNNIITGPYQILAYADDIAVLARTKEELKGLVKKLKNKRSWWD